MSKPLKDSEILGNLKFLADWLRVKHPGEHFELVVAGGAAMALEGFKGHTTDVDLLSPKVLPDSIRNGVAHVGRVKRLGSDWLNTSLAHMLSKVTASSRLPQYFSEISRTIDLSDNLRISLVGRQALISLKMYAATPSYRKHTLDIRNLQPDRKEMSEAIRFVMSIDDSDSRRDDLRIVLKDLGFDFDEIQSELERNGKPGT